MPFLLLALLAIPLIEIAGFVSIGGSIGVWPTLAWVVLTAILGIWVIRGQGYAVLQTARRDLNERRIPLTSVIDGALVFVAGLLLVAPGFFTDALGFVLLVPPMRGLLTRLLVRRMQRSPNVHIHMASYGTSSNGNGRHTADAGPVIDGEVVGRNDNDDEPRQLPDRKSPWQSP